MYDFPTFIIGWYIGIFAFGFTMYSRVIQRGHGIAEIVSGDKKGLRAVKFRALHSTFISCFLFGASLLMISGGSGGYYGLAGLGAMFILVGTLVVVLTLPSVYKLYSPGRMARLLVGDWMLLSGYLLLGADICYPIPDEEIVLLVPLLLIAGTLAVYSVVNARTKRYLKRRENSLVPIEKKSAADT